MKKQEGIVALKHLSDNKQSLLLSPNPTNTQTYLNLLGYDFDVNGTLEIYNSTGLKIQTLPINGTSMVINTEHLNAGIYTLNIIIEGQLTTMLMSVYH